MDNVVETTVQLSSVDKKQNQQTDKQQKCVDHVTDKSDADRHRKQQLVTRRIEVVDTKSLMCIKIVTSRKERKVTRSMERVALKNDINFQTMVNMKVRQLVTPYLVFNRLNLTTFYYSIFS